MTNQNVGVWKGSMITAGIVATEIASRWGEDEVKRYDPLTNCLTYNKWKEKGYQVRKGEKGIKSITYIKKEVRNKKTKEVEEKIFPRSVTLFFDLQVDKAE